MHTLLTRGKRAFSYVMNKFHHVMQGESSVWHYFRLTSRHSKAYTLSISLLHHRLYNYCPSSSAVTVALKQENHPHTPPRLLGPAHAHHPNSCRAQQPKPGPSPSLVLNTRQKALLLHAHSLKQHCTSLPVIIPSGLHNSGTYQVLLARWQRPQAMLANM